MSASNVLDVAESEFKDANTPPAEDLEQDDQIQSSSANIQDATESEFKDLNTPPEDLELEEDQNSSENVEEDDSEMEQSLLSGEEESFEYVQNEQDITKLLKSDNPVALELFTMHFMPLTMELDYEDCPTVKEFMAAYLSTFIEPGGWIAEWVRPDYQNLAPKYEWPRPQVMFGLVEVQNVDIQSLMASGIHIIGGSVDEHCQRGDLQGGCRTECHAIPIHELVPMKPKDPGTIINIETLKAGLSNLRILREELMLTQHEDTPVDLFFYGELARTESLFRDLKTPGCLNNKIRTHILELICDLRWTLWKSGLRNELGSPEATPAAIKENQRLSRTQNELQLYLIPEIRKGELLSHDRPDFELHHDFTDSESRVVVVSDRNCFDFQKIELIKNILKERSKEFNIDNTEHTSFATNLDFTLQHCEPNSVIFLLPGEYEIPSIGTLALGGSLIGLLDEDGHRPRILTHGTGDIWNVVDTKDIGCSLENIEFEIPDGYAEQILQSMFLVTSGSLRLTNCELNSVAFSKPVCNAGVFQQLSVVEVRGECNVAILDCVIKGARSLVKQPQTESHLQLCVKNTQVHNVVHLLSLEGTKVSLKLDNLKLKNVDNPSTFGSQWSEETVNGISHALQHLDDSTKTLDSFSIEHRL